MAKRTIKFRGQRDNGEFVVGHYCVFPDGLPRISVTTEKGMSHYLVKPETVGQYIGIQTSVGEDIYEGMKVRMLGNYDRVTNMYEFKVEGIITFSGTSFGIWSDGYFWNFDQTPWDIIELISE